jgi:hypothetical protein
MPFVYHIESFHGTAGLKVRTMDVDVDLEKSYKWEGKYDRSWDIIKENSEGKITLEKKIKLKRYNNSE